MKQSNVSGNDIKLNKKGSMGSPIIETSLYCLFLLLCGLLLGFG
ncbi:MAG: hypothetical protein ThorAB25_17500 [Candidatus Thorarchaeota archaeon AB_25]|nr:MAG: hypothetical protein ThorAB25_17500 [Candidatus Thorarchaeota archaeon AB_25]